MFSAVCPYCQEEIEIDLEAIEEDEEITCPNCHKEITLEWDDDCGCGCGCGCDSDTK